MCLNVLFPEDHLYYHLYLLFRVKVHCSVK